MPTQTASKAANSNFISDYLADWDDEPSRPPSPEPAKKDDKGRREKSKTDVLGIEQQIDVKKKPRVPRVKLDEARSVARRIHAPFSATLLADSLSLQTTLGQGHPQAAQDSTEAQTQGQGTRGKLFPVPLPNPIFHRNRH